MFNQGSECRITSGARGELEIMLIIVTTTASSLCGIICLDMLIILHGHQKSIEMFENGNILIQRPARI